MLATVDCANTADGASHVQVKHMIQGWPFCPGLPRPPTASAGHPGAVGLVYCFITHDAQVQCHKRLRDTPQTPRRGPTRHMRCGHRGMAWLGLDGL